ncbi:MAG: hypothetical protein H6Q65_2744, partial [Firmicutes bacterium]|nr:hypothetical protein [Bacillota bacterium]
VIILMDRSMKKVKEQKHGNNYGGKCNENVR